MPLGLAPSSLLHTCPAKDCVARIPLKLVMCRAHWHMVPKSLQDAVWAAYHARNRKIEKRGTLAKLREAQLAAVRAVNEALEAAT